MQSVSGGRFNVRAFECLGACEIAPMASVDGEYVGPLTTEDCTAIAEDLEAGRPVLEHKQLRRRKAASRHWQEQQ
jgi:NADH-quinone oxidoreductase subunit E